MNTDFDSGMLLANSIVSNLSECNNCEVIIYPPYPYLQAIGSAMNGSNILLGAQNLWPELNGAFTGEVSATMLTNLGVSMVLIGHSERRHIIGESNELISLKVHHAISSNLRITLCVGETLEEREGGSTFEVIKEQIVSGLEGLASDQMQQIVIAYEPVWAIGTGKTATPDDAGDVHRFLRSILSERFDDSVASQTRIQYGGSVNASNATELFANPDIDGALVGGASLSADSFTAIIEAVT